MSQLHPTNTFPPDRTTLHRTTYPKLNEMAGLCLQFSEMLPDLVRVLKELGLGEDLGEVSSSFTASVTGRNTDDGVWPASYTWQEMQYDVDLGTWSAKLNGRTDQTWFPLQNTVEFLSGFGTVRGPRGLLLNDPNVAVTILPLDFADGDLVTVHTGTDATGFDFPYCSVENAFTVECAG